MHRLNLLSLALLLLSPVTLLASYLWNRQFQIQPKQAPPEQQSIVPSPTISPHHAPLLPATPRGIKVIPPLNRTNSLPRADYLPPLPNPSGSRRVPQISSIPVPRTSTAAPPVKVLAPNRGNGSIKDSLLVGSSPFPGASTSSPWINRPAFSFSQASLAHSIAPTSISEFDREATAPMVTIVPPSSTVMAMTPSLNLPPENSGSSSSALNNPTSAVFAQAEPDPIRQELLIQPLAPVQAPYRQQRVVGAPAATLSTPTGYGASFGQLFAGLSLINRGRGNNQADGSATIGIGLGNPRRAVGFDVAVNVISLSDSNGQDSFAGSGNVGFKLHRMLPGEIGVAVGWENALAWGDAKNADSSVYGAVSRAFFLQPNNLRNPMPLILSMGVGGGRFRSEEAIRRGDNTLGFFASAGLQLSPQFSLLANWTGQDLNVGASFIPFPEIPFSLTLSAADLTGSAGDGARFALGLGYGTRFSF